MSMSREAVMAAILAQQQAPAAAAQPQPTPAQPAPRQAPPQNALQRLRNQVFGGDTSRAAYQAYALQAIERGEQPLSYDEFRRQQPPPRNALKTPQ